MENQERGLRYISLTLPQAKIFVFIDGSFTNNQDLSSQIRYVVTISTETSYDDSFT